MPDIINTTPHSIVFDDPGTPGGVRVVEPCGVLVNARGVEDVLREEDGVTFVRTHFEPDPASLEALEKLERENPRAIIVGSVIAAQAYPGRVAGLTAAPGFERVPTDRKRMNLTKFILF